MVCVNTLLSAGCVLEILLCRYVWEHKTVGYTQGMVDLCAPLMVVFDDGESVCIGTMVCFSIISWRATLRVLLLVTKISVFFNGTMRIIV